MSDASGALTLDTPNTKAGSDTRGNDNLPMIRMTGIRLTVDVAYTNWMLQDPTNHLKGNMAFPPAHETNVDAYITVKHSEGWAGTGPQPFFVEYPSGPRGARSYHRVIRYRQSVMVDFRATGKVYTIDFWAIVNTIVATLVFLNFATTLTDALAFYGLGSLSKLLRNKRDEKISRTSAFAELGLKAAVAVDSFSAVVSNSSGGKDDSIDLPDLVAAFGKVKHVNRDQALTIAQTILRETDKKAKVKGRISFNEFMTCTEGSLIPFDDFVKETKKTAGSLRHFSKRSVIAAQAAYDKAEQEMVMATAVDSSAPAPASVAAGAVPAPPTVTPVVATAPAQPATQTQPPPQMQPPPQTQPQVVTCGSCRRMIGVPSGATVIRCPHCGANNMVGGAVPPTFHSSPAAVYPQ